MADGYRHDFTEELEAVARGVRRLDEISDPALRDAVRAALGLRAETPGLDAPRRARMRRALIATAPAGPRLSDRVYDALALVAAPAPYLVRALAVAAVAGAVLAGATVASADALPDEPLYAVKSAAEDLRVALAVAPEDRALVELSLAEHRLSEAERLAALGRESGTLVAASAYGSHLARAAAELAEADVIAPRAAALIVQLEARLIEQRRRAASTARLLMADGRTALAGVVLAQIVSVPDAASASTALRIAEGAAHVAQRLAHLAEERAQGGEPLADALPAAEELLAALDAGEPEGEPAAEEPAATPAPAPAPTAVPAARPAATARPATPPPARTTAPTAKPAATPARTGAVGGVAFPAANASARPTPTRRPSPTADPSARLAADRAKQAAEQAKQSATKAQEAAKRTPPPGRATPKPTPTRRPSPTPR